VLNTIHRNSRLRSFAGGRIPFSYDDVLSSEAVKTRLVCSSETDSTTRTAPTAKMPSASRTAVRVHLSDHPTKSSTDSDISSVSLLAPLEVYVDRVQICKMGSRDPQGAYVSVGEIRI
jgi:hypothetical protein